MIWHKIIKHKITLKTINNEPMALSKCMYCLKRYAEKELR